MKKIVVVLYAVAASGTLLFYDGGFDADAIFFTSSTEDATSATNIGGRNTASPSGGGTDIVGDLSVPSKASTSSFASTSKFNSYVVSPIRVKLRGEGASGGFFKNREGVGGGSSSGIGSNGKSANTSSGSGSWLTPAQISALPTISSGPPPPGPPPVGLPINKGIVYLFLLALCVGFYVNYKNKIVSKN